MHSDSLLFYLIYYIAQIILTPLLFPLFLVRWIFARDKKRILNRWGLTGFTRKDKSSTTYWFHAASIGEILSLEQTIKEILLERPGTEILISTQTPHGRKIIDQTYRDDRITGCFLPYDHMALIALAFIQVKPSALTIVEAERWPMLYHMAKLFKIKLIGFNSRIRTEKKLSGFTRRFYKIVYSHMDQIWTEQVDLFQELAGPNTEVLWLGSSKTSNVLAKKTSINTVEHPPQTRKKYVLLLGSVHEAEIGYYLRLFSLLQEKAYNVHLMIAPRRFAWGKKLRKQLDQLGFDYQYFTKSTEIKTSDIQTVIEKSDISVFGFIGILFNLYQHADIFYLGGTYNGMGGHNVLEAASFGIPIITGPSLDKTNYGAYELLHAGALIKLENQFDKNLLMYTRKLLDQPAYHQAVSSAGKNWLEHEAARVSDKLSQFRHQIYRLHQ